MVYVSTANSVNAVKEARIKPCAHPPIQITISSLTTNPNITHKITAIVKVNDATVDLPKRCIASPTDKIAKMHGIKPPRFDLHIEKVKIL